jgi:hypothetical protein
LKKERASQRQPRLPTNTIPPPSLVGLIHGLPPARVAPRGTCTRKDQSMLDASRQSERPPTPASAAHIPESNSQIYTPVRVRSRAQRDALSSDRLLGNSAITRSYERQTISCQRRWTRPPPTIRKNKLKESAPLKTRYTNCTPKYAYVIAKRMHMLNAT